jgi:galactonate dehydratase
VAPTRVADTAEIRRSIKQKMAGGETLFSVAGFAPLVDQQAADVIMPDVKHCGGLLELTRISAHAASRGVTVAPHNPSGPVATAASIHVCAGMRNFAILEMQWGEVDWRGSLVRPAEEFVNGQIAVPDAPGLGITLDGAVAARYSLRA